MKLETYLAESGLKQETFAKMVGVSQPHISRLLRGESWPQKELLERIRLQTGGKVTANDFLADEAPSTAGEAA